MLPPASRGAGILVGQIGPRDPGGKDPEDPNNLRLSAQDLPQRLDALHLGSSGSIYSLVHPSLSGVV